MQYGDSITGKQLMYRFILPIVLLLIGCTQNIKQHDYIGAEFLGMPYVKNPLGEGMAPDTDPLIRFDAFDCATFVETAIADGNIDKLNKIRYKGGKVDFLNRNHFIETDWLENNSNIVTNISAQFAPTVTRHVTIDKKKWFKTVHNVDTDFTQHTVDLEYIPYKNAQDIHVDRPVIVLFIINNTKIRNKIGTDLAVRHMGFLLPDGVLRHASRKQKRVVDTDFNNYVNRMLENKNNLGIMLLEFKK